MATLTLERLTLLVAGAERADQMASYIMANQAHLGPWTPPAPPGVGAAWFWKGRLPVYQREAAEGRSLRWCLVDHASDQIIGTVAFTNIVRGPFQACHVGYAIDHRYQGRGLMGEALEGAIAHAFGELKLHRLMANYMRENTRSARLLERLEFEREGFARSYLYIAGAWRDFVLTARTNPTDAAPPV